MVVLSSINADFATPSLAAYAATKAALNNLVQTAALELASDNIRINAIAPASIDTPAAARIIRAHCGSGAGTRPQYRATPARTAGQRRGSRRAGAVPRFGLRAMDHRIDLSHRRRRRCHAALRPTHSSASTGAARTSERFLIGADGAAIDEYSAPAGVVALDRDGMAATMDDLAARWPNRGPVYASGMIGSNVGWIEVPYAEAPAGCADLAAAAVATQIGNVPLHIVPGVTCRRSFDGEPDILRGEEIELMGLAALRAVDGWVALPGTHTKWARLENGRIVDFFTSMSGEIFDRLTAKGLLASIVDGEAADGPVFLRGVAAGRARRTGPRHIVIRRARTGRARLARRRRTRLPTFAAC